MAPAAAAAGAVKAYTRCQACTCMLGLDDNHTVGVCVDCAKRPEGKRLLAGLSLQRGAAPKLAPTPATPPAPAPAPVGAPRAFTVADKSLIKNCHAFMPPAQLLAILNERLHADLGPDAPDYTLEQLHAETTTQQHAATATDWSSLRQVLAIARRCGVLEQITPQVIDDFAVVFHLSSRPSFVVPSSTLRSSSSAPRRSRSPTTRPPGCGSSASARAAPARRTAGC
jgi:hypothetical protein